MHCVELLEAERRKIIVPVDGCSRDAAARGGVICDRLDELDAVEHEGEGDANSAAPHTPRGLSAVAFQAHASRVTAVAQLRGLDVLVTLGDGLDPRPSGARAASRHAALAARDRLRRETDAAAALGGGGEGAASAADLGFLLGLGVPLELPPTPAATAPSDAAFWA